jgi:hypothetical protein
MLPNPYLRFLALAGIVFVALVASSIAFCVYVDPYRMYGTDRIANKPQIYAQASLAKAYMLERVRPDTLILGNEAVEMGLDPANQDWPEVPKPAFNASGADVDVFMAWRLLQHDIAVKPPQLVILGLDYLDFVKASAKHDSEAKRDGEARLLIGRDGKPNDSRSMQLWTDFFATTLSRQAIADSIKTFRLRNAPAGQTMSALGFNPSSGYDALLHTSGAEAVFSYNDAFYREQYRSSALSYFYSPLRNPQFRALANIVKLARENDIRLILYIPPYHSRYLEILHETGFWAGFEAWKRALVRTIDDAAGNGQDLILLYDFSGYDDISGERVPAPGDTQLEMRWFRDSTHYTPALGSLLVASMMAASPVLGEELNDTTLEGDLERVRRDRDRLFAPVELDVEIGK